MHRRLFSSLLALALMLCVTGGIATPANAAEYMEYADFHIYKNGGSVVSDVWAQKTSGPSVPMETTIVKAPGSTVNWLPSETVYWRGRSSSYAKATTLGEANQSLTDRELNYLSGFGTFGTYYTLAAQYADTNPYTHLEIWIYFKP